MYKKLKFCNYLHVVIFAYRNKNKVVLKKTLREFRRQNLDKVTKVKFNPLTHNDH